MAQIPIGVMHLSKTHAAEAERKRREAEERQALIQKQKAEKERQLAAEREAHVEKLKASRIEKATSLVHTTFKSTREDHDNEAQQRHDRFLASEQERKKALEDKLIKEETERKQRAVGLAQSTKESEEALRAAKEKSKLEKKQEQERKTAERLALLAEEERKTEEKAEIMRAIKILQANLNKALDLGLQLNDYKAQNVWNLTEEERSKLTIEVDIFLASIPSAQPVKPAMSKTPSSGKFVPSFGRSSSGGAVASKKGATIATQTGVTIATQTPDTIEEEITNTPVAGANNIFAIPEDSINTQAEVEQSKEWVVDPDNVQQHPANKGFRRPSFLNRDDPPATNSFMEAGQVNPDGGIVDSYTLAKHEVRDAFRLLAGVGVQKDERGAVEILLRIAQAGHPEAQNALGFCYQVGRGVPQDDATAVALYERAALQNHPKAQFNVGLCYMTGIGGPVRKKDAIRVIGLSAGMGYADAQCYLGTCFQQGKGVSKSESEAFKYFQKAALQGHVDAIYYLATCVEKGKGCKKNAEEALYMYKHAAAHGHEAAIDLLKKKGIIAR